MNNLKILENCYTLRYAAGQYWLLDISQPGVPYKSPMCLNEVGAEIWRFLADGCTVEHIVAELSREYDVVPEEIKTDILQFINQLKTYGVKIEE